MERARRGQSPNQSAPDKQRLRRLCARSERREAGREEESAKRASSADEIDRDSTALSSAVLIMSSTKNILTYLFPLEDKFLKEPCSSICLVGKPQTCKTSLLLQAAIGVLQETLDAEVVFFSPIKIDELPPSVHHMSRVDSAIAKRLSIHYLKSADALLQYFATFGTKVKYPRAIVVDALDLFMNNYSPNLGEVSKTMMLARILALIVDQAKFCAAKSGHPCYVFAATSDFEEVAEEKERIPAIAAHFFDGVFALGEVVSLGRANSFEMTNEDMKIKFYLDDAQLFIDSVTIE